MYWPYFNFWILLIKILNECKLPFNGYTRPTWLYSTAILKFFSFLKHVSPIKAFWLKHIWTFLQQFSTATPFVTFSRENGFTWSFKTWKIVQNGTWSRSWELVMYISCWMFLGPMITQFPDLSSRDTGHCNGDNSDNCDQSPAHLVMSPCTNSLRKKRI